MQPDRFLTMLKEKSVLIAQHEEHLPALFVVKEEEVAMFALSSLEKDMWKDAISFILAIYHPDFYAMVVEAYAAGFEVSEGGVEKMEEAARVGVRNLPADDRKDILIISLFENEGKARFFTMDVYPEREKRGVTGAWREEKFDRYESAITVSKW